MRLTNKFGLPDTIMRAVRKRNASYDAKADRSITQLINPPQIDILRKRHFAELEKDVSEEFYALLGSGVHQVLEWGAKDGVAEERLHAMVNGWAISGGIDLQQEDKGYAITDYKVTSAYVAFKDGDEAKWEWEAQLNCYAYLVWLNKGVTVDKLTIVAILRDWARRQAEGDPFYPQSPITPIAIPVWPRERQEEYLRSRVELHQRAEMEFDLGLSLPECTPEERWTSGDKWAVIKPGGKRAKKVFESAEEAEAFLAEAEGCVVEHRPGQSIRCGFCQVSDWCEQFKRMNEDEQREQVQGSD